jgi:hypothetical protein
MLSLREAVKRGESQIEVQPGRTARAMLTSFETACEVPSNV